MKQAADRKPFQTLLVIVTGLLGLGVWMDKTILLYIALGIGLLGIASPFLARWIDWGWYKLAEVLGWINGRILLSIVFFVFLVPIALLYQLSTKNPLSHKNPEGSMFKDRNHTFSKEDLEKSW